jgi:hypothetical protein
MNRGTAGFFKNFKYLVDFTQLRWQKRPAISLVSTPSQNLTIKKTTHE